MHTYTHTHAQIHTYTYTHTHAHIHTHTYTHTRSAPQFEFHTLFRPSARGLRAELAGQWRDPCEHFMCERRECSSKYIRYVRTGAGPYASGRPKKYTDSNFLRWEEDVCGVTRLSLPEGKALRRIVETHRMR